MTDPLREELFKQILEHADDVKYAATVMSPNDISMGMLRKTPYNLCVSTKACTGVEIQAPVSKPAELNGSRKQECAESRLHH